MRNILETEDLRTFQNSNICLIYLYLHVGEPIIAGMSRLTPKVPQFFW